MIKFENTEVVGFEAAIRGMRNPMNSWEKSDSEHKYESIHDLSGGYIELGPNDLDLMKKLRNAGTDHRKFMRMITVYVDITAPLYWWKEFDTYKVGTVANSCSTMHKIQEKEFTLDDFSYEHIISNWIDNNVESFVSFGDALNFEPKVGWSHGKEYNLNSGVLFSPKDILSLTIHSLNACRQAFLRTKNKKFWWQMIQLLPSSYNQKRTIMLNYEVLANIYKSRKNHKLDEWCEHPTVITDLKIKSVNIGKDGFDATSVKAEEEYFSFCDWVKTLPYSELIVSTNDAPVFLTTHTNIQNTWIKEEKS